MKKRAKSLFSLFLCVVLVLAMIPSDTAYAAARMNKCKITLTKSVYTYTGKEIKPSIKVKYGKKTLKKDADYSVSYKNNVLPGTATITVKGKGKYSGSIKKTFTIKNAFAVTLSKETYTYNRSACKPKVTVKSGKKTLSSSNYSVTYKNNTKAGKASVTIAGKGSYKGKKAYVTFKINPKSIKDMSVKLSKTSYTYEGKACKPTVTVKDGKVTLKSETDYTVEYKNNNKAGTATAIVKGKGNYKGTVEKTFTIKAGIYLSPSSMTIKSGERKYIKVKGAPADSTIIFSTEDKNVATVDRQGEVIGNNAGKTKIKVKVNDKILYCDVTVKQAELPPQEDDYLDAAGKSGYIGGGADIGLRGKLKESIKPVTWKSSDETVAKVSPYPDGVIVGSDRNDAYIEFIGPGKAIISATDGEYTGKCEVTVKGLDNGYIKFAGGTGKSSADFGNLSPTGFFETGQAAASVIGAPELEQAEGWNYNHQNGMAYYYDSANKKAYFAVSDVYNNRVLIYKGGSLEEILKKDWSMYSNDIIVLGQTDINGNTGGYTKDKMNWPMDVAIDKQGKLYVTDTRNHRILVFDNINTLETGISADHSIEWYNPDHSTHLNHIQWPWAVSTENDGKLIVTDTAGTNVLIWDKLPLTWEEGEDYYYPNLILSFAQSTTPRAISWTDSQLFIGDENIPGFGPGERVFNGWPTTDNLDKKVGSKVTKTQKTIGGNFTQTKYSAKAGENGLEDFIYNPGNMNCGYGSAVKVGGRLYFYFCNNVHIFEDGKVDSATDRPDLVLGTVNARYSDETGFFFCGGGSNRMIYAENKLLINLHQMGEIVGFSYKPTKFNDKPDIRFGGESHFAIDEIVSHSDVLVGGDIAVGDNYLVSSNELSKRLYLYDGIPTSSGVKAQAMFDFNYLVPGPTTIHKDNKSEKTILMTVTRTHGIFYIWHDYKDALSGKLPDTVFGNRVGTLWLTGQVTDIEFDGNYTYLTLQENQSSSVYIFDGLIEKEKSPFAVIKKGGSMSPGEDYLAVIPDFNEDGSKSEGSYLSFYKMSDINEAKEKSGLTEIRPHGKFTQINIGSMEGAELFAEFDIRKVYKFGDVYEMTDFHAMDLIVAKDLFAFSDLSGNRILIWNKVDDALAGKAPRVILGNGEGYYSSKKLYGDEGEENLVDLIPVSNKNTIVMPKQIGYDGTNIWVSEFKFANRILRFAKK